MSFLSIQSLSAAAGSLLILRRVSLDVPEGIVHGLVGESGAGKSMIGKSVLGTLPSAIRVTGGKISLAGEDLSRLRPRARREMVAKLAALIPQDPLTALNPSRRIEPQITDRLTHILGWDRKKARDRAADLLAEVHITEPGRVMASYPHQLSGGMRQRVLIAAAFAAEPRFVVADEPTTALDVMVQKEILRLIREMQERHKTAMLFVTHDLGVVSKICQSFSVLYSGAVIEESDARSFFSAPRHPYCRALLAATPRYTDPENSLQPVDMAILQGLEAEIAERDARHG